MEKLDLKKKLKNLYSAPKEPTIVEVPRMKFLAMDGEGDPNNSVVFQHNTEALYGISYSLKFMAKKLDPQLDYVVMPLEGLWWTDNIEDFSQDNKDIWKWTLMIMQPDFITADMVEKAIKDVEKKKGIIISNRIRFEEMEEGLCAHIMHIGPYAEEQPTVEKLHSFIKDKGCNLRGKHREIYLSDPRKADPSKMKTIIRNPII